VRQLNQYIEQEHEAFANFFDSGLFDETAIIFSAELLFFRFW